MSQILSFYPTIKASDFKNPNNIRIDISYRGNTKELGIICKIWNATPDKYIKNVNELLIKKSNKDILGDCDSNNIITLYTQFLHNDISLDETIKRIMSILYHEIGHAEYNNLHLKQKVYWYQQIKNTEISSYIHTFKNKLKRTQKNYKKYIGLEFYNREIIQIEKDISAETYAEFCAIRYSRCSLHTININDFKKILSIHKKLHEVKQDSILGELLDKEIEKGCPHIVN